MHDPADICATMSSSADHYRTLLAPIYTWMVGGMEAGIRRGAQELDALGLVHGEGRTAVDLGAGFGMHAIPLAQRGYRVTAIDESAELLDELRVAGKDLQIDIICDSILDVRLHLPHPPSLVVCMGDTITHLPSAHDVRTLVQRVAAAMENGGMFVMTFRDYTIPGSDPVRIIPVRSDDQRILTCVLVDAGDHMDVYDVYHHKADGSWTMQQSSYRKLKLVPADVERMLEGVGFDVRMEEGMNGMIRLIARKHHV